MDKKIKLNSKMNMHIFMTDFWLGVGNVCIKIANFASCKATDHVRKNIEISKEMLDYPDDFKTKLAELSGKGS